MYALACDRDDYIFEWEVVRTCKVILPTQSGGFFVCDGSESGIRTWIEERSVPGERAKTSQCDVFAK